MPSKSVVTPGQIAASWMGKLIGRSSGPQRCRKKFLRFYSGGFQDADYRALERDYKWDAHEQWMRLLNPDRFAERLKARDYAAIALDAVRIESPRSLLFSFEKMALRDAIRDPAGAKAFATGLFAFLYGSEPPAQRFAAWVETVAALPRRQTRVLTWPSATVFGFIAQPKEHFFVKPNVTRRALSLFGLEWPYVSRPNWDTYQRLLDIARQIARDLRDLRPADLIDIQSFLWVQGSDEYR